MKYKIKYVILLIFACLISLSFFCTVKGADSKERKIIKVGYPIQAGLTDVDENGNYSGYTYEYLIKISHYTSWEYEFVEIPGEDINDVLLNSLEMLKNGEIDILGGMVNSPDVLEVYDLSSCNYGMAYSVISVLEDNKDYRSLNDLLFEKVKIAIIRSSKKHREELIKFCDVNNINAELIDFDTEEEQIKALKAGTVDAMIEIDVSHRMGNRIIAKFSGTPYYFATTKGNFEIINQIDSAITEIKKSAPYFEIDLYSKYFENKNPLILSTDEEEYVKKMDILTVLIPNENMPFCYRGNDGQMSGISIDICDLISKKTGLKFEFKTVDEFSDVETAIGNGEIDMILGISSDYKDAAKYGIILTEKYISSPSIIFINKSADIDNLSKCRYASIEGLQPAVEMDLEKILYYNTVYDCIMAVNKGKADFGCGSLYSFEHIDDSKVKNIIIVSQNDSYKEYCIGVPKIKGSKILYIINSAIKSISDMEINNIIFNNGVNLNKKVTLVDFINANAVQSIVIIIIAFLLIIGVIICILNYRLRASNKIKVINERYAKLAELSNEFMFEYNYVDDRLTLTEKCAKNFKCPQIIENYRKVLNDNKENDIFYKQLMNAFNNQSSEKNASINECDFIYPDGSRRWTKIISNTINDNHGNPLYSIGKLVDIHKEKEKMDELIEKSEKDSLTGILNAATCRSRISSSIENIKAGERSVLIILDIDNFKSINDTMGHYHGDEILKEMAYKLTLYFKNEDIIGRLGGDEFIVYVKNIKDMSNLMEICGNINKDMRETLYKETRVLHITVSIGAAILSHGDTFENAYKDADKALYKAKKKGKNSYCISGIL